MKNQSITVRIVKILLLLLVINPINTLGSPLVERWHQRIGTDFYNETILGLDVDAQGNVYIVGTFKSVGTGGMHVGYDRFGSVDLVSVAGTSYDIYVVKYSPQGAVLQWNVYAGYNNYVSECVKVSPDGSIYLLGYFDGTMNLRGRSIPSNGGTDVFLFKMRKSDFEIDTILTWGSTADDKGVDMAIDDDGNVYVTGTIQGNTTGFLQLNATGKRKIYVSKIASNLTPEWNKIIGSEHADPSVFALHVKENVNVSYMDLAMLFPEYGMVGYNVFAAYDKNTGEHVDGHGIMSDLVDWEYEASEIIETDSLLIMTYFRNTVWGKTNHVFTNDMDTDNMYRSVEGESRINSFTPLKNKLYQGGIFSGEVYYRNEGNETLLYTGETIGYVAIFNENDKTVTNIKTIPNSLEVKHITSDKNILYVAGIQKNPKDKITDVFIASYIDTTGLSSQTGIQNITAQGVDSVVTSGDLTTVYVPFNTYDVPVLSVELSDTNATHTLIQAQSLSDTTTISVTSENTLHTQKHKVIYVKNRSTVAYMTTFDVLGADSVTPEFDTSITHYTAYMPYWYDSIPGLNIYVQDENASFVVSSVESLSDTMTITVMAHDTTIQHNYTLNFIVEDLPQVEMENIQLSFVHDSITPAFDPAVYDYTIYIPDAGIYTGAFDYELSDPRLGHLLEKDNDTLSVKLWINNVPSDTLTYRFIVVVNDDLPEEDPEDEVSIKNVKYSDVEIYPNPFTNSLNIVAQGKKYRLVSSDGQELATEQNVSEISTIDLPAGMYFVVFEDWVYKAIKQ
jgi:hypothetical protein